MKDMEEKDYAEEAPRLAARVNELMEGLGISRRDLILRLAVVGVFARDEVDPKNIGSWVDDVLAGHWKRIDAPRLAALGEVLHASLDELLGRDYHASNAQQGGEVMVQDPHSGEYHPASLDDLFSSAPGKEFVIRDVLGTTARLRVVRGKDGPRLEVRPDKEGQT